MSTANWPAVSLSFSFGGIADQSSSCARVAARYSGLANGLPGTTEASSLSPPLSIAAREDKSKSPFSFFPASPWHVKHLALKIPRTFNANRRSPSWSAADANEVSVKIMAVISRISDNILLQCLLSRLKIALFDRAHNGFVFGDDFIKPINAGVIHQQPGSDALPDYLQLTGSPSHQ